MTKIGFPDRSYKCFNESAGTQHHTSLRNVKDLNDLNRSISLKFPFQGTCLGIEGFLSSALADGTRGISWWGVAYGRISRFRSYCTVLRSKLINAASCHSPKTRGRSYSA